MSEITDYEQTTLDQLHVDLLHLASALRKRGPKYEEHAKSMEWCADQLAAVKEARNAATDAVEEVGA